MISAIQTYYNGTLFRSRLEAKWAVFFDEMKIEYEYEPEGYDLGDGVWYLPDFYLPKQDCFIEIKGKNPTKKEIGKCISVATGLKKKMYLFFGNIPNPDQLDEVGRDGRDSESAYCFFEQEGEDYQYAWCECDECGEVDIEYNARSARISCPCEAKEGQHPDKLYNGNSERLNRAYKIARNTRF